MIQPNIPGMGQDMNRNAVSIYDQGDAMDEFPVLKAFQQYIDAEQDRARKRMMLMGLVFCVLMGIVISIFVMMLLNGNRRYQEISQRNQVLNDRLVEFAMKERDRSAEAANKPQSDNSVLMSRLEAMQKQMAENQARSEKAAAEAIERAKAEFKAQPPSTESQAEIARLKALLQAEKDKISVEREKLRQAELEIYRRKMYPSYYAPRQEPVEQVRQQPVVPKQKKVTRTENKVVPADEDDAIDYFQDDEDIDEPVRPSVKREAKPKKEASKPDAVEPPSAAAKDKKAVPESKSPSKNESPSQPAVTPKTIKLNGDNSTWSIPND